MDCSTRQVPVSSATHSSSSVLKGVRVLDLTIAMAGPLATARMSDLGADVIKIESPAGDFSRQWPIDGYRHGGESSAFLMLNRGKRGICLDLKQPSSQEILHRLVAQSDILVQNFRPRVAAKLGIDFATLNRINPKLVYVAISGYGDEGPMVDRPGQDLLVQSFSGLAFNAGTDDGLPHPSPVYMVDTCASHLATEAALAGYIEAQRTGKGREFKVSLLAAALEIQIQEISTFLNTGRLAPRSDRPFASVYMEPPYGIYRTADGFLAIAQARFPALAEAFGDPALAGLADEAPPHADVAARRRWRDKAAGQIAQHVARYTTEDLINRLTPLDIWVNPVQSYADLANHEQFRPFVTEIDHAGGPYRTLAPAIDTGETRKVKTAPRLGEHTDEVLAELGFDDGARQALHNTGAAR
ncbi:Crotonobetainyl-CoA:carnitine CoA-transferase CaiB-like acyl-CoA transferase [Chelatococcus asaccharovorans]|nr:Crotonobetainyl-CoA:carnitine CoA-transferase CaiB-like acyl-CoA transferase [Chelatococcus asaccharovorans]CAH1693715.1 Crotonobetainyl-CoA:carnitine CoA-transferase CaiB-like acyl-CoA transferase [Chelatococcus asaccharovorans]